MSHAPIPKDGNSEQCTCCDASSFQLAKRAAMDCTKPCPYAGKPLFSTEAPPTHPDDHAVDCFAAALKSKLAEARAKGRGGWSNDEPGMQQRLSDMLRAHVAKGDPRDVGNFAMFLHQRGEAILPRARTMMDLAADPQLRPASSEPASGEAVACWRWRRDGFVSLWVDGSPPERLEDFFGREMTGCTVERAYTHPAEPVKVEAARPMDTAPRDSTMLRLLVRFDEHPTEDAEEAWTIGHNSFDANGEDEWRIAGWCWSHDHFTEGKGTPIGWLPMNAGARGSDGDASHE